MGVIRSDQANEFPYPRDWVFNAMLHALPRSKG